MFVSPALVQADNWKLVGISGQQGDTTMNGVGGFLYPDHTLFDLDSFLVDAFGVAEKILQLPFVNDSQAIGYCEANGLLYHTGGSESYSNNPLRAGHDQGGPDILGVGYQDSQYMAALDVQFRTMTAIFNAAPCPNPDPTLPCFGLPAPRPSWVLPIEQRNSTQIGGEYRVRGSNEYHAARGLAWSASHNAFFVADEAGIFKLTTSGECVFVAQPTFPVDNKDDVSKAILVVPERLLIGHRDGSGQNGYLMEVDAKTGTVLRQVALKYPADGGAPLDSFGGLLGMAQHPVTGEIFGVRQTSDHFARELVTINPRTGDTVFKGNMGLHIASIAFVATGNAAAPWRLVGITGQQGDTTSDGAAGYRYPDHTLYDLSSFLIDAFGVPEKIMQLPFVNDSQAIGFCPADGLLYHTGGSESYSNNPLRAGHDQGGPDILGVGYQDSQYMETVNLATKTTHAIFNAAPCPNPDPTLPCFGLPAPRPNWVLPVVQRTSAQTDGSFRARGVNEYHAARGLAWSASQNAFYVSDENGIFRLTPSGECKFIAQPSFPIDSKNDAAKAILVIPERILVGHRDGNGQFGYLIEVDAATGAVDHDIALKYPPNGGAPVDAFGGLLGLAQHPVTHAIYGVRQTSDHFARELVQIDPNTGDTTLLGNLALHIASIAFVPNSLKIRITRNGANLTLDWVGATGPYQVQASANLTDWTNVGDPIAGTSMTVPLGATPLFYRVVGN
jgi:hypothetical protein